MRPTGFEPATVGFGVQRSTVGATPSYVNDYRRTSVKNLYHEYTKKKST